jgi:chorismate-pyruvate lyase
MDSSANVVTYVTNPSGKIPLGILLNDMVNIDLTRQHINWHKDELQKGGKVTVLRKGYVVTNLVGSGTPTAGAYAYVADSGYISTSTRALILDLGAQPIGRFMTAKDTEGYAKVEINLP